MHRWGRSPNKMIAVIDHRSPKQSNRGHQSSSKKSDRDHQSSVTEIIDHDLVDNKKSLFNNNFLY